mmetsp:Transcript_3743/g.8820  ORF Transcript_3743/g.8820 Transcript_3743/m.8820 type:complete len:453 (-) Transcript_3743:1871-3229(-)
MMDLVLANSLRTSAECVRPQPRNCWSSRWVRARTSLTVCWSRARDSELAVLTSELSVRRACWVSLDLSEDLMVCEILEAMAAMDAWVLWEVFCMSRCISANFSRLVSLLLIFSILDESVLVTSRMFLLMLAYVLVNSLLSSRSFALVSLDVDCSRMISFSRMMRSFSLVVCDSLWMVSLITRVSFSCSLRMKSRIALISENIFSNLLVRPLDEVWLFIIFSKRSSCARSASDASLLRMTSLMDEESRRVSLVLSDSRRMRRAVWRVCACCSCSSAMRRISAFMLLKPSARASMTFVWYMAVSTFSLSLLSVFSILVNWLRSLSRRIVLTTLEESVLDFSCISRTRVSIRSRRLAVSSACSFICSLWARASSSRLSSSAWRRSRSSLRRVSSARISDSFSAFFLVDSSAARIWSRLRSCSLMMLFSILELSFWMMVVVFSLLSRVVSRIFSWL